MSLIEIYADVHNSENYAKGIDRRMREQNPDGLFLESDNKSGKPYLFRSLGNYPTLGSIFGAFDTDIKNAGIDQEHSNKALWEVNHKILKRSLEYLFQYAGEKPTTANMTAINEPNETWKTEKVDEAMNSLIHQMNVRQSDDRSTLWSRLAYNIGKNSIGIYFIDMDRSKIWRYGANNISQLPDNPTKVKKAYKLTRKGKQNPYVKGVKKLFDSSVDMRDETMAIQVKTTVEKNSLRNPAVVVGREHCKGIAKLLEGEFKVSITNVG